MNKENLIITIVSILIVLAIGFYLFYSPDDSTLTYNDFNFQRGVDGFYYVELNTMFGDQIVPFYYHPNNLTNIDFNKTALDALRQIQLNDGNVKIAIDAEFKNDSHIIVAGVEISKITGRVFGMPTTSAFTQPIGDVNKSYTCEDANNSSFVILFNKSNEKNIQYTNFCTILNAPNGKDAIMLADLFVFSALGVMK